MPLTNPLEPSRALGNFKLRNLDLGGGPCHRQAVEAGGVTYHGHLDPATGMPARGLLAVAVVCRRGGARRRPGQRPVCARKQRRGSRKASALDDTEAVFVVDVDGKPELRLTPGMEAAGSKAR